MTAGTTTADKSHTIFANVLNQFSEKKAQTIAPPRCAVIVTFYHTTHIEYVAKSLQSIAGEFSRVNDSLIQICENQDAARKLYAELNAIMHAYDTAVLSAPFAKDWLAEYFQMQSLGINVVMVKNNVTSIEDEVVRQASKEHSDDGKQYASRREYAKANILNYSFEALKADVAQFLLANMTISPAQHSEVLPIIDSMFNALSSASKGKIALEAHANSRIVSAVERKSKLMLESTFSNTHDDMVKYQNSFLKVKSATDFLDKHELTFDDIMDAISVPLAELFSLAEATNEHVPFTGPDLMYSSPYELSDFKGTRLLSLAGSRYCAAGKMAAYLLTDLFLEFFRITTKAKHREALLRLSDSLSPDNLYSDAIESIYRDCAFC
jgi:hypothetical protein